MSGLCLFLKFVGVCSGLVDFAPALSEELGGERMEVLDKPREMTLLLSKNRVFENRKEDNRKIKGTGCKKRNCCLACMEYEMEYSTLG